MSYQSKYTGQEIDELLDKVNAGGGSVTTLFEGEFADVSKMSPVNFLADSIYNYDLVAIVGYQKMDGGGLIRQIGTILTPSTIPPTDAVGSASWSINNFADANQMGYFFDGNFGDGTQLCISAQRVGTTVSSRKHGICTVVGIKLGGGDSAPTGNIISFMGTKAPKGYLVCDGAEYNIADYPKLASHFEEQFEDVGYFGGDGITTFKVPDLRNEFLRGYGELSNEIGIHQDGTENPYIWVDTTGMYTILGNDTSSNLTDRAIPQKADTMVGKNTNNRALKLNTTSASNGTPGRYTSRPTNVAVLYCIKY